MGDRGRRKPRGEGGFILHGQGERKHMKVCEETDAMRTCMNSGRCRDTKLKASYHGHSRRLLILLIVLPSSPHVGSLTLALLFLKSNDSPPSTRSPASLHDASIG